MPTKVKKRDTGRKQARRKAANRQEFQPKPADLYADFDLSNQRLRFTAIRPDLGNVTLDDALERVEWRDEGSEDNVNNIAVLRGSTSFRAGREVVLLDGHSIRADLHWGDWRPLWQMRVVSPPRKTLADGAQTVELADDLWLASRNQGYFRWHARGNQRGWLYHTLVLQIARRYRIPVGKLVKGRRRIKDFPGQFISPLEAIRQLVAMEANHTGRRYVITWEWVEDNDGKGRFCLNITHPERNPVLFKLQSQIRDGELSPVRRDTFATAVTVAGVARTKSGKRVRHVHTETNAEAIRRYGYIERRIVLKERIEGKATVVRRAKTELAKNLLPVMRVTNFQHSGIAVLRRGHAVKLDLPDEGLRGSKQDMFVVSATHTYEPAEYTMALDLTTKDPFDPTKVKADREAAARARKRSTRGKNTKTTGRGAWLTVGATVYTDPPPGAYGGSLSMGYAELRTASAGGSATPNLALLAPLFGIKGELPENFAIEIRNPATGQTVIGRKRDRGYGQPSTHYKLDLWSDLATALGVSPTTFKGNVQIRRV